jgi:hypothetical protein
MQMEWCGNTELRNGLRQVTAFSGAKAVSAEIFLRYEARCGGVVYDRFVHVLVACIYLA